MRLEGNAMGLEREADSEPVFLLAQLLESCEGDVALAQEVLQDFLEATPLRLSRLAIAVAADKPSLVRLEAHSLKGSSQTIGAEALARVGARLEEVGIRGDLSSAPLLLAEANRRLNSLNDALVAYLSSPALAA